MNDFDALIAELSPLVKALPAGGPENGKIRKAAAEAGADIPGEDEGGEEGEGEGEGGEEGGEGSDNTGGGDGNQDDGDRMGKSLQVTLADGTVAEAFDASLMLKSLDTQIVALKAENEALRAANVITGDDMAKSLSVAGTLTTIVKGQGELIKSLRADFARIASAPAGRKVTLSVHEKVGGVAPPESAAVIQEDVMAKAMTAQALGKISASDVCRLEAYRNRGLAYPPEILAAMG